LDTSILPFFSTVYLVVNALDECHMPDEFLAELLKLMETNANIGSWLHLVILEILGNGLKPTGNALRSTPMRRM